MLNVIEFLEKVGQDARLRHGSPDEMQLELDGAGIDSEFEAAIMIGDQAKLEALLGQTPLCAMFFPSEEEGEDEDEEKPSKEPDEESATAGVQVLSSVV